MYSAWPHTVTRINRMNILFGGCSPRCKGVHASVLLAASSNWKNITCRSTESSPSTTILHYLLLLSMDFSLPFVNGISWFQIVSFWQTFVTQCIMHTERALRRSFACSSPYSEGDFSCKTAAVLHMLQLFSFAFSLCSQLISPDSLFDFTAPRSSFSSKAGSLQRRH